MTDTSDVKVEITKPKKEDTDFTKSLADLKQKLNGNEISVGNMMTILRFSMEVVEMSKVKGEQQRELAVKLIRQVIVDAPISDDKEKLLLDMIDQDVIASTIDLVIAASRGQLEINQVTDAVTKCCGFTFTRLLKK
tara:strand:- start:120 stop:527 length:408 start_codon:yes stop_codon:yes gene_type:complete